MRQIRKQAEPRELREHRLGGGRFEDPQGATRWKERLQDALLRDQGGLCCYCMKRLERKAMKIEHLRCQERNPDRELDYDNLFAACPGNEGVPWTRQTCDARKRNDDLHIDPSGNIEPFIRYRPDGTVVSSVPGYQHDFDQTLNLNLAELRHARAGVLEGLIAGLERETQGTWKEQRLLEELARWEALDHQGNRREFCAVVVYFLKKRLRRM